MAWSLRMHHSLLQILYVDQVSVKESLIFVPCLEEEKRSNLRALEADQSMLVCGS